MARVGHAIDPRNLRGVDHEHEVEKWSPFKAWAYSLISRSPRSNLEIVELAGVGDGTRFLDIGCGPGAALEHAAARGASVAGVDPSPSMVERAAIWVPTADGRVASAESLPVPDDYFDVVINVATFHHWADREAGLVEALRVLAPGGRLHVVEGMLREGKDGHGLTRGEAEVLAARLAELGFTETEIDDFRTSWRHQYLVVTGTA